MSFENRDGLLHVSLLGGQARALLMESTAMVEAARQTHKLSRTATAALGRSLTATAMMGCMLKGENESLSTTITGDGPLGRVLCVAHSDGTVKGYVDHPEVDPPRNGKKLNVGAAVGRHGRLSVVKDMGMRDPYVGQVNLVSGEIAEDYAMYFTASEQTTSLVSLGVLVGETVESAGGLIIQLMPGASEAAIQSIEHSAGMFMDISATIKEYHLHGALQQLLMHLEPEVLEERKPRYACDCSRERIVRMLITLGADELRSMIAEQHGAEVDCHFCNKRYRFNEDELNELLRVAAAGGRNEV